MSSLHKSTNFRGKNMGTRINGEKPKNNVTISRGGETPSRKVDPDTGKTNRSFAQPSPSANPNNPTPKNHASAEDAIEALERNSKNHKKYRNPVVDDTLDEDEN